MTLDSRPTSASASSCEIMLSHFTSNYLLLLLLYNVGGGEGVGNRTQSEVFFGSKILFFLVFGAVMCLTGKGNRLQQQFSTGGALAFRSNCAMSADILDAGGDGCYWYLVGRGQGCC